MYKTMGLTLQLYPLKPGTEISTSHNIYVYRLLPESTDTSYVHVGASSHISTLTGNMKICPDEVHETL